MYSARAWDIKEDVETQWVFKLYEGKNGHWSLC